jgi:hypothetical protein
MVKKFFLPLTIALMVLTFSSTSFFKAVVHCAQRLDASERTPPLFTMRVVDEQTGMGVAGLRVSTDNGIICYTRANGDVIWVESSLMSRGVRFEIKDERNQFDGGVLTLRVMPGGQATVKVHRRT